MRASSIGHEHLTAAAGGIGFLAHVSTHGIPGGLVALGAFSAYAAFTGWPRKRKPGA